MSLNLSTEETTTPVNTDNLSENIRNNIGIVKWFNGSKGFGFIRSLSDNSEIFVHHSNLQVNEDCWKTLIQGEYVEYDVDSATEGRVQAKSVTGIKRGPLMCESNKNNNLNIIRSKWTKKTSDEQDSEENVDSTSA